MKQSIESGQRFDVFLCYARADRDFVDDLVNTLREEYRLKVFYDADLNPGDAWDEKIPEALRCSRCTLVVLSDNWSVESTTNKVPWYAIEQVHLAVTLRRRSAKAHKVIPATIGRVDDRWLPYGLNQLKPTALDDGVVEALIAAIRQAPDVPRGGWPALAHHVSIKRWRAFWARDRVLEPSMSRFEPLSTYIVPTTDGQGQRHDLSRLVVGSAHGAPARLHIVGPAGAGKGVRARQLARYLAHETDDWLPVMLSPPDPARLPFGQAEEFGRRKLGSSFDRFEQRLEDETKKDSGLRIALILDVDQPRPCMWDAIEQWTKKYPSVAVVIFSRPVGRLHASLAPSRSSGFRHLGLNRLDEPAQSAFVEHYAPAAQTQVILRALKRPSLRELARNPQTLRWVIELLLETTVDTRGGALPWLCESICSRRIGPRLGPGVSTAVARHAWALLTFDLRWANRASWTQVELGRAVARMFHHPEYGPFFQGAWLTPSQCLDDLLADDVLYQDGREWKYESVLIRTFLIAEGLWNIVERAGPDPFGHEHPLLRRARAEAMLGGAWQDAVCLAAIRCAQAVDVVEILTCVDGWNGETLAGALRWWLEREAHENSRDAVAGIEAWLEGLACERLTADRRVELCGFISYALDALTSDPSLLDRGKATAFEKLGFKRPASGPDPADSVVIVSADDVPVGFTMGAEDDERTPLLTPDDEDWRAVLHERERPRQVVLSQPFSLLARPVTLGEYRKLDPTHLPGIVYLRNMESLPVTGVTWWQAYAYATWIGGRLPTEAEWEYACRAGTKGPFFCPPEQLADHAWFEQPGIREGESLRSVATKEPNPWGLHDMLGLIWEWVDDRFSVPPIDGSDTHLDARGESDIFSFLPSDGLSDRVAKGGGRHEQLLWVRCAARTRMAPGERFGLCGFRVAFGLCIEDETGG